MRKRTRNAAHFILLVLITAFILLIANMIVFTGLFAKWKENMPFGYQTIMENLTIDQDNYSLSDDVKETLKEWTFLQ